MSEWAVGRPLSVGRHDTCAVVGNSGVLLSSERGAEIDAHEAVLRINYAPTKGFEKYVGSRTTYDLGGGVSVCTHNARSRSTEGSTEGKHALLVGCGR